MADGIDPTAPKRPGRSLPGWWLVVVLLVVPAVGVGAVLLLGGDDNENMTITLTDAPTASTESAPESPRARAPGSNETSGGSGSSVGRASRDATPTPSSSTTPGPAKPEFTSAYADPDSFTCTPGELQEVDLHWSTTNATSVTVDGADGYEPNSFTTIEFACGTRDSVKLVAHGPGGDTSTSIGWRWQEPQQ